MTDKDPIPSSSDLSGDDRRPVEYDGKTVLVVDDSSTVRSAMSVYLERNGYKVVTAVDGFAAISELARIRPIVVFADVVMPRIGGYEFCVLVNSSETLKGIPVVLVSSKNQIFDRARARVAGCRAFLSKPFTEQQLLEVINQLSFDGMRELSRSLP